MKIIKQAPLKLLLIFHGVITFAAAIVLIISPKAIPAVVEIDLHPGEYLLCYLLGAAELGIAFLIIEFLRTGWLANSHPVQQGT
jgi:hypothetical protein